MDMGAKYTDAQARATAKYQKEKIDMVSLKLPKGTKDVWRSSADRQGQSLQRYIIDAVEDRIDREDAQNASILSQVAESLSEAHSKPYTVTFRTARQFPSGDVETSPEDAQKVIQASSADEARVAFFAWLKEQTDAEVAFEEPDKLGVKMGGVIEICKIVSVE